MSGFEVTGVVLGAFPIAIAAVDGYKRLAQKVDAWNEARQTYRRCSADLKNEQLVFKRHLRMLVLPLVVDRDSAQVLLEDVSGQRWKDADIADLLESKLGESYELYLGYMRRMEETLADLSEELKLDSDLVQDRMAAPKPASGSRFRSAMNKESRQFQAYKLKFIQGEATRRRLFKELRECNGKLEKLLKSSEKDAQLTKKLEASKAASAVDVSLCTFWKTATAFFKALAAACKCQCREAHAAKLLLQHRASCRDKARFEMVFTINSTLGGSSAWEACTTRIEEDNHGGFVNESIVLVNKRGSCQKHHGTSTTTTRSQLAVRPKTPVVRSQSPRAKVQFAPSVLLTAPSAGCVVPRMRPIRTLCESLLAPEPDCRDYLHLPDEDRRYYICSVAKHARMPAYVTLEQILNGDVKPGPSRQECYAIALILASSFLQLLESPWFPPGSRAFDKTSVFFLADPCSPNVFLLHQPHIRRPFTALDTTDEDGETGSGGISRRLGVSASLVRLGITLLELCFRAPLEGQPYREALGAGRNEAQREAFDRAAAEEWLTEVDGEAGEHYAAAVLWCIVGNRTVPAGDRWWGEMFKEVVRPLQQSLDSFKRSLGA